MVPSIAHGWAALRSQLGYTFVYQVKIYHFEKEILWPLLLLIRSMAEKVQLFGSFRADYKKSQYDRRSIISYSAD